MAKKPDTTVEIAPDPNGLGERFMAAFNDMEHRIRESGRPKDSLSALSKDFFNRRGLSFHLDAFSDFVDLRNTLAHGRHFRGGLLATPAPEVVEQIEALRDLVMSPPRALTILDKQTIVSCDVADSLDDVLPLIAEYGYTNIPVHDGPRHVGLLTPRALANWLAVSWDEANAVHSVPVGEVLEHAGDKDQPVFAGPDVSVAEVVQALVGDATTTRAPAVLITADGSQSKALLAIATGGDLPRLVKALDLV